METAPTVEAVATAVSSLYQLTSLYPTTSQVIITQLCLAMVLASGEEQLKLNTVKCYSSWMTPGCNLLGHSVGQPCHELCFWCSLLPKLSPHSA